MLTTEHASAALEALLIAWDDDVIDFAAGLIYADALEEIGRDDDAHEVRRLVAVEEKALTRSYQWFRSREHRASDAIDYAKAERRALDAELGFDWEQDKYYDPEDNPRYDYYNLTVYILNDCGERITLASLCGIGMSGDIIKDYAWRREYEAELAIEALAELARREE